MSSRSGRNVKPARKGELHFSKEDVEMKKQSASAAPQPQSCGQKQTTDELTSAGSGMLAVQIQPSQSKVVAKGDRNPRAKPVKAARGGQPKHLQHAVALKDTYPAEEQFPVTAAKQDASKGKPAQVQAASFVRTQVSQRAMGIVGALGTTAPVSFSKRRPAVPPSVTTIANKPPPSPPPVVVKPKRHSVEKRRKISAASSLLSETVSTKTEGISHTTLQDLYVSRVEERLEGDGALVSSSSSFGQGRRPGSSRTGAVDVLSAVSSATQSKVSIDSTSVGVPPTWNASTPRKGASSSQSSIGSAADAQEHYTATGVTSSSSLSFPAPSSKLAGLSALGSRLSSPASAAHSRVSSARHSVQVDNQLQSNSLKLEVDLTHLQMVYPEQDESRPSSAASGGLPEAEESASGRRLLLKPSEVGGDAPCSNDPRAGEVQRRRRDADILEGSLKRRQETLSSSSSVSMQRSSASSVSSTVSIKNWEQKQSVHPDSPLINYDGEIANAIRSNPKLPAAGSDADVLSQFLVSGAEDMQAPSKAPCSMNDTPIDSQTHFDAYAPLPHRVEGGEGSQQTWNSPIVVPRPTSKTDSSLAATSELHRAEEAHSPSASSSNLTNTSLRTGSCSAGFDDSNRASPISLHSSSTGQLLAALLAPLSSDLGQLSSAHSGSATMPSSNGEMDSCSSTAHTAPQTPDQLLAHTCDSPVRPDGSRMPSDQEEADMSPPFHAQASSCNIMASSGASCGSSRSGGVSQIRVYATTKDHHKEGSVESGSLPEAASVCQVTELLALATGTEEQEVVTIGGVQDGNLLPSTPSLCQAVETAPLSLSAPPGGSVEVVVSGDVEAPPFDTQYSLESLKDSKASTESTLLAPEDTSPPNGATSSSRRTDQYRRSPSPPPGLLSQLDGDSDVPIDLASGQKHYENTTYSPQDERDQDGLFALDMRQMEFGHGADLGRDASCQGTPSTESQSTTHSLFEVGPHADGGGTFDEVQNTLHQEGSTRGEQTEGKTALDRARGSQLSTSDILDRKGECSKSSLTDYLLRTDGPVTLSDIMNIKGHSLTTHHHPQPPDNAATHSCAKDSAPSVVRQASKLVLLSTSSSTELTQGPTPVGGTPSDPHGRHNIHHFCAAPAVPQLSAQLQALSAKTHTAIKETASIDDTEGHHTCLNLPSGPAHSLLSIPSSFRTSSVQVDHLLGPFKAPSKLEPVKSVNVFKTARPATAAHKEGVGVGVLVTGGGGEGESSRELSVQGVKLKTESNDLSLIWQPAPPKFGLHPSTVRSYLFPNYQGLPREERRRKEEGPVGENEDAKKRLRDINRAFQSLSDLSSVKQSDKSLLHGAKTIQPQIASQPPQIQEPEVERVQYSSGSDSDADDGGAAGKEGESALPLAQCAVGSGGGSTGGDSTGETLTPGLSLKLTFHSLQKQTELVQSTPLIVKEPSASTQSTVEESFRAIMEEVKFQRKQLLLLHSSDTATDIEDYSDTASSFSRGSRIRLLRAARNSYQRRSVARPGGAGKRKTPKRRTKSAEMRANYARRKLTSKPLPLQRSTSYPLMLSDLQQLTKEDSEPSQLVRTRQRRSSEPAHINFEAFLTEQGIDPCSVDPREWANKKWDKWFDEVYAEYRAVWEAYKKEMAGAYSLLGSDLSSLHTGQGKQEAREARKKEGEGEEGEKEQFPELENIDLIITEDTESKAKSIQCEIERLDSTIAGGLAVDTLPIHLCRRGALLRKVGKLKVAKEDLDKSLHLQPKLADSYWQRHLLFLIQGNVQAALKDLESVLALNSVHILALQSKASLLQKQGSVKEAVELLDIAIQASGSDPSLFMFRAALKEELGESALAVEDYTMAAQLDQRNTRGLMKQGLHCYDSNCLNDAMLAFTQLLQRDPNSSQARIYRAKVEWKKGDYPGALKDLSAVIHLSPDNSEAFFLRGCLLRKSNPKRALKDFSVSLLLDDSAKNASSVLHRGILYSEMGRFDDALADFSVTLQLVPSMACAHINIGLVHLKHLGNPERAVTSFTQGLKVDPTYVRGYLCRAEALVALSQYKAALRDLTSAIHLAPDQPSHYLSKGCVHMHLAEYELAESYVRTASAMSGAAQGHLPLRDAAVASFLGNSQEAVDILTKALEVSPSPSMWYLLGRIHQKATHHMDAVKAFQDALQYLKSSDFSAENTPSFRSDCFHSYGVSLLELNEVAQALTLFSKATKANRRNSQAYYYRSLCKLKLHGTQQALPDINRALELEPNQFEVSLTRANMFAEQGRFKKALFNCSKAIELHPDSARAHMCSGCFRMHLGKHAEALEDFNMAAKLCPTSPVVFYNRALCHQELGNSALAIKDYSKAMEISGKPSLQILVNRGLQYLESKDYTRALEDIIAAGQLSPRDATLFQAIGLCYHKLGELEQATAAYTQAVSLDPLFWEAIIGRGNAHLESLTPEGVQRSMRDYARVLHIRPFNSPARINLAYLLQMEGKLRQAWEHFSLVLTIDPSSWQALEGRSVVSLQAGYLDGALKDISDAIKISKTAELLNNRGVIYEYLEDRVNAARDYAEAVRVNPTFHLAHFNMGNLYFHHRQFAQAVSSYSCALEHCHQDESSLVNRAICRVIQGDTSAALAELTMAADVNPYAAHIYYNRGNLYKALGQYEEAEEDYRKALSLNPQDHLSQTGLDDIAVIKRFTNSAQC